MRKILLFVFLFFVSNIGFGQFMQESYLSAQKDSLQQKKSTNYIKKREFKENLKEKYNDKEFQYTEEIEEATKKKSPSRTESVMVDAILFFISNIFPFLLGAIIVFIILRTFLGSEIDFWNFKKSKTKKAKKLVYEDEDIHETDIEGLLQKAIKNKAYRLAIRYYYLAVLKTLSNKKLIDYHKDKTNSEYLFEIKDENSRKQFSYLSYVYSYVWYGEFSIDEANFKLVENKYQSFKNSLK